MKIILQITLCAFAILSSGCGGTAKRTSVLKKDIPRMQKSIKYHGSIIFLQRRKRGSTTNDLIIESKNKEIRYLSDNKYFIQDFCISKDGMLYYIEAGRDIGYEPMFGVRSSRFTIKKINLNSKNYEINNFFPYKGINLSRPNKLELDNTEKFICFATDFGEIYVIDRLSKEEIDIMPSDIGPNKYHGEHLTEDRKSFIASIYVRKDPDSKYVLEKHKIDLRKKVITTYHGNY